MITLVVFHYSSLHPDELAVGLNIICIQYARASDCEKNVYRLHYHSNFQHHSSMESFGIFSAIVDKNHLHIGFLDLSEKSNLWEDAYV